jgi:nucleoside-triphosphatase THEP1
MNMNGPESGPDTPATGAERSTSPPTQTAIPPVKSPTSRTRVSGSEVTAQRYAQFKRDVPYVDWDQAGPELIGDWSRPDKEHIEIFGPSGSGKSTLEAWLMVQRAIHRNTGIIIICTKRADRTIARINFPVAKNWNEAKQHRQVIIWANPDATGKARREHIGGVVQEVLEKCWVPESNNLICFDEIAYVEKLSPECKELIEMYLREARSADIELLLMKQRPQGATREMHAETAYTFSFKPKDANDAERIAEIFGDKRGLTPVLLGLKRDKYEFLAKSEKTDVCFISHLNGLNGTSMPRNDNSVFERKSSQR